MRAARAKVNLPSARWALPVEQPLMYVGHRKFTKRALDLPTVKLPLPRLPTPPGTASQ
jgi:hypothetical protein